MLAAVLALALCAPAARVEGVGPRVDDVRPIAPETTGLVVHGALQVDVVVAEAPRAVVSAEANLQPLISLTQKGATLELTVVGDTVSPAGIRVTLEMPAPSSVSVLGAARVATPLRGEARVETSGASRVRLTGQPERLTLLARGASAIDATGVTVGDVVVEVAGAVEVEVAAQTSLSVAGGGVGRVRYRGNPRLQTKVSPTVKVTRSRT
jgi:hypothetical protein